MLFRTLVILSVVTVILSQRCPDVCLAVFSPVCARMTQYNIQCTFGNSCHLGVRQCKKPLEGWRLLFDGICRPDSASCAKLLALN